MSIDALKQELSVLNPDDQRHLVAFLVSLQETQSTTYRERLARKIDDRDPSHFATLEEMDKRLKLSEDGKAS